MFAEDRLAELDALIWHRVARFRVRLFASSNLLISAITSCLSIFPIFRFQLDGLLTSRDSKHDVALNPLIIAPDPFASEDCLDAPTTIDLLVTSEKEVNTMSAGEDDPSTDLNARLRPRKFLVSIPRNKAARKLDGKTTQERPKRNSTPSKASSNKQDDLPKKFAFSSIPQFLCPYCDKKFASKQTVSKHICRMHYSSSKQGSFIRCLFCNHIEAETNIIRHMVNSHPNQYFACLECLTRFSSTSELADHKLNVCEKQKVSFRSKLRQKEARGTKLSKTSHNVAGKDDYRKDDSEYQGGHGFTGIVISCELKSSQVSDEADIEDNITTNLILPSSKNLVNNPVLEKSAVIVLDDIQWNKRIPPNFSFQNTDPDQILSRLGVVHKSPRTNENSKRDWLKSLDDATQKFERCFDTNFYSKVANNVQENLSKFLDGSFSFNPDPDSTIKTRKSKNSVVINTVEGFPILLAHEQYSRSIFDSYLPRAIAPKHKWKWDNLENEKITLDQFRRDSHVNNCIVTLVSNLDIWTQLCMRRKYDDKFNNLLPEKKTEKQNIISRELKEILESREIPTTSQVVTKYTDKQSSIRDGLDFPASLGLTPSAARYELQPAVLSGEWVRPRCYVCCACGAQTRDSRALTAHMSNQHSNAYVQHYEIVGDELLSADILKHLYVPPSQMSNRTRPPRGFRDCTKCKKSISLEDLHQHMLDCAGDTPIVRRRQCRYRPFGVRRRRPRLPDNSIRKKMRKDIRARQRRQKIHMRPRSRPRTEVGDAETIRKMLADLPAKRHRVLLNPINMLSRPRRKLEKQRTNLMMKKRSPDDANNRKRNLIDTKDTQDEPVVTCNDTTKKLSSIEDDEDNKPLCPKIKRIISKRKLQNDAVKKKTTIKRAKRRTVRVELRKIEESMEKPDNSITSPDVIEISPESELQKIDVNKEPFNFREQANSSGSGRRDDQRPGCSGTNGNVNNSCDFAQNMPLKHSIARLTANSETHDKSVQFHHSFLVQQECNNVNQNIRSEHRSLFENEAAVTRLDKPPLFSSKVSLDLYALQKNKLNKPRKGLNDCIAMLKNKLADPGHVSYDTVSISHISIQCGTDEPIDIELQNNLQIPTRMDLTDFRIAQSKSVQTVSVDPYLTKSNKVCDSNQGAQSHAKVTEGKAQNKSGKKKLPTLLEIDTSQEKAIRLSPEIEIMPMAPSQDNVRTAATKSIQKAYKNRLCKQLSTIPGTGANTSKYRSYDPAESKEIYTLQYTCTALPTTTVSWNKPLQIIPIKNTMPDSKHAIDKCREEHLINTRIFTCGYPEKVPPHIHQNLHLECNLSGKESTDVNMEDNDILRTDIPPAHASTNVESILTAPLDLSSRILTCGESHDFFISPYMPCNYDSYESLDLSNKNVDTRTLNESILENDVIVDLRVKHCQSDYQANTLDLCVNSTVSNMVADLSVTEQINNEPTDLSVLRSSSVNLTTRNDNSDYVQDLSVHHNNVLKTESCEMQINPTDLSVKRNSSRDTETKDPLESQSDNRNKSLDLVARPVQITYIKTSMDQNLISNQKPITIIKQPKECKKNVEKSLKVKPLKVVQFRIDKSSAQYQKPVYDPNFKIPQFKLRSTTTSDTNSSNMKIVDLKSVSKQVTAATCIQYRKDPMFLKSSNAYYEYSSREFSYNTAVVSVASNIPNYILPIRTCTSSVSKFESTTPVYALANTCISVTRIEPSATMALTNPLLSIPGSTIASTIPVYTLASTTIAAPINVGTEIHCNLTDCNNDQEPFEVNSSPDSQLTTGNGEDDVSKQEGAETLVDLIKKDPELARKIAMIPKPIVEILNKMPENNRNQLLDVLPHYVSTTTALSMSSSNVTQTAKNTNIMLSLPASEIAVTDLQYISSLSNIMSTVSTSPRLNVLMSPYIVGVTSASLVLDKSHIDFDNTNKCLTDSITGMVAPGHKAQEYSLERIIDLTEEDNLPSVMSESTKLADDSANVVKLLLQEKPAALPILNTSKQNSNSDQTASLRAIRIKTPSERQKENQMLKMASERQNRKYNRNYIDNYEVNKLLATNKYLAIQQAEISSTQHNNKTIINEWKVAVDGSSVVHERNPVDHYIQPRQISTPDPESIKKDCENLRKSENCVIKSGTVTSSITAADEINKRHSEKFNDSRYSTVTILQDESLGVDTKNITMNVDENKSVAAVISSQSGKADDKEINNYDKSKPDDDDSEDDVSLAVIVKKKQRNEHKIKSRSSKKNHEQQISIKKKKKKTRTDNTFSCVASIPNPVHNNSCNELISRIEENVDKSASEQFMKDSGDTKKVEFKEKCEISEGSQKPSFEFKKKTIHSNKTIEDADVTKLSKSDMTSVNRDEDNVVLPLRRSRRGKSLFVDSSPTKRDSENNQKTPLTKKQLIFSKLLLDEENHKNVEISTSYDNVFNNQLKENLTDDISLDSVKKRRPGKRKKTPQGKKKKKVNIIDSNREVSSEESLQTINRESFKQSCNPASTFEVKNTDKELIIERTKSQIAQKLEITFKVEKKPKEYLDTSSKQTKSSKQILFKQNIDASQFVTSDRVVNKVDYNKTQNSTEKRKNTDVLSIGDISSKPKRKRNKLDEDAIQKTEKRLNSSLNESIFVKSEELSLKTTATRRTRSKDVVVKSTCTKLYDPYDINLDDMVEETEPSRKETTKSIMNKILDKPILKTDIMIGHSSNEFTTAVCESKKQNDVETKNKDKNIDLISDVDAKTTGKSAEFQDEETKLKPIKLKINNNFEAPPQMQLKENESDTDDSSKSDVPLKNLVEEKTKRPYKKDTRNSNIESKVAHSIENLLTSDNDKKELSVHHDDLLRETQEKRRSEQFLESFGFFSERKPRKSNLLASKKISETFHVIANESDDVYFTFKDRTSKQRLSVSRKSVEAESTDVHFKKNTTRGRKKKTCTTTAICYCYICKKEFRRPDNYLRHQMTLLHISKLSEVEMSIKTVPVSEEPNYLIAYKQQLDRLKILRNKLAKRKKNSKSKIKLPTLEEILENVNRSVREQQITRTNRSLSRDEALFLDCCELLKESHKNEAPIPEAIPATSCVSFIGPAHSSTSYLIDKSVPYEKSDGDVDSITAKTILESEEVRNLENDLISGLKEAACANASKVNISFQHTLHAMPITAVEDANMSSPGGEEIGYVQKTKVSHKHLDLTNEPYSNKHKKHPENKEKMYPHIEEIDMFEDKFDKIKRKCRSQAAAAKQTQTVTGPIFRHKGRKKSDKKKRKKSSKKVNKNTVLTKGALKEFDGIKVAISASSPDINMTVVPSCEVVVKEKKKSNSKKNREKRECQSRSKYHSDAKQRDVSSSQKKVDVYEFMDNEDAELFEFRPSTLMERFKSINSKDMPSTSNCDTTKDEIEKSSVESTSDEDDFVYMSDDYVCSDDETENSIMSDLGNIKSDLKKTFSLLKRKDVVDKNAVMGKIFKHNAVRSENKATKIKDFVKSKANLDQLFDSLLEEGPSSSMIDDEDSPVREQHEVRKEVDDKYNLAPAKSPSFATSAKCEDVPPTKKVVLHSLEDLSSKQYISKSPKKYDIANQVDRTFSGTYGTHITKNANFTDDDFYGPSTSKKLDLLKNKSSTPKKHNLTSKQYEDSLEFDDSLSQANKSLDDKCENSMEYTNDFDRNLVMDDAGVAKHRARRRCTVGKQNVLAETWSSESEPDGATKRPNSAESVVSCAGRKKKSRKKEGQQSGPRRSSKQNACKKHDIKSGVTGSIQNSSSNVVRAALEKEAETKVAGRAGPSVSGRKGLPRAAAYYWTLDSNEEQAQEHLQQHGWIVGDSHKKLVTMLAHAKGRKRHNDDKHYLIE